MQLPIYLKQYGFFPNRPWDKIIDDMGLEVVQRKTFVNGTIQYQILKNNKAYIQKQKELEERRKASQAAAARANQQAK